MLPSQAIKNDIIDLSFDLLTAMKGIEEENKLAKKEADAIKRMRRRK